MLDKSDKRKELLGGTKNVLPITLIVLSWPLPLETTLPTTCVGPWLPEPAMKYTYIYMYCSYTCVTACAHSYTHAWLLLTSYFC